MTLIQRPAYLPRLTDHLPGAVRLYVEPTLPADLTTPILEPHVWERAESELEQVLASHEEYPHPDNRFLVGRMMRQMNLPGSDVLSMIYYDYIMTRQEMGWSRQLSVWSNQSHYDYDFDVFEMRPIEQSMGLQ